MTLLKEEKTERYSGFVVRSWIRLFDSMTLLKEEKTERACYVGCFYGYCSSICSFKEKKQVESIHII